jgi:hypothetical protein
MVRGVNWYQWISGRMLWMLPMFQGRGLNKTDSTCFRNTMIINKLTALCLTACWFRCKRNWLISVEFTVSPASTIN